MIDKKQNKVFIKTSNYWAIHDFALFSNRNRINGMKLQALYQLIQAKGEIVKFSSDRKYEGIKVLEYGNGCFIGFIRTGLNSTTFYPCRLQIICLQKLDKNE